MSRREADWPQLDDRERALVERARAGSLPAFTGLVKRFEGRLFNFLLRRTRCPDDAEDLAQEAFMRAWQNLDRYDARWQFSTWLFTNANRRAIAHHKRARPVLASDGLDGHPCEDGSAAHRRAADREQYRLIWDLADRLLSETQRTALWLRYAEDLSNADIAAITGRSRVSVRVTLFRAREALAAHERSRRDGRPAVVKDIQAAGLTETLTGDLVC